MTGRRFFVTDDLQAGVRLDLPVPLAHRLRHVLRLKEGTWIRLFNGRNGEWQAVISFSGRRAVQATPDRQTRTQNRQPGPWLFFSPIKRNRLDTLVEKATELGVHRLIPVISRFTITKKIGLDRLKAIAQSAAEQCERLDIPVIDSPHPLEDIAADWPPKRRLFMCVPRQNTPSIHHALVPFSHPHPDPHQQTKRPAADWALMIGPEGGFAPGEPELFDSLPGVSRVHLGPHILRTETAAIAALSCWQAALGNHSPAR